MPNSIGPTGITTATQAELLAAYVAGFQAAYSNPNISLASNTPDGQIIGIIIQSILDLEDLLVQSNSLFDPDQAVGVVLDQRVAINGIQRKGGTFTIQPVVIYTTAVVNLYGQDQTAQPVYTVADAAGNQYQLQTTQTGFNPGGTGSSLTFVAVNSGAVSSAIGAITVPVTIILGVGGGPAGTGIYNSESYSTLGQNEETDAQLRVRRSQSVALSSQGYLAGLYAALDNISGVGTVTVQENDTSGTVNGIPGHSIWVIVGDSPAYPSGNVAAYSGSTTYVVGQLALSGGVVYASGRNGNVGNAVTNYSWWWPFDQVAWAIYLKRNAGCGMKGSITKAVTQVDGSQFVIAYDTVSVTDIFVACYLTALAANTVPNYTDIQQGLPTSYDPAVNQELNINALATAIQTLDSNSLVTFSGADTPSTGGFCATVAGSYTNTLTPATANIQFALTIGKIILLPSILSPVTPSVAPTFTQQFNVLGGYSPNATTSGQANTDYTWAISVNNSGGSISAAGLYTAGSTPNVTDTVTATDSQGNAASTTVSVT